MSCSAYLLVSRDLVWFISLAKFGSYPFVSRSDYKTIITVQASDTELVAKAVECVLKDLPAEAVVGVDDMSPESLQRVNDEGELI